MWAAISDTLLVALLIALNNLCNISKERNLLYHIYAYSTLQFEVFDIKLTLFMNLYLLLKKVIFRWPTFSKLLFIINFYTNLLLNNVEALIYCRLNLQPCYLQPFILFLYFTNLLYIYFFVAKKQKKVLYSDILHINNNKLHINWTEKKWNSSYIWWYVLAKSQNI